WRSRNGRLGQRHREAEEHGDNRADYPQQRFGQAGASSEFSLGVIADDALAGPDVVGPGREGPGLAVAVDVRSKSAEFQEGLPRQHLPEVLLLLRGHTDLEARRNHFRRWLRALV